MLPVESSAIEALDYEPKRRKLIVSFAGGATYSYAGVPAANGNPTRGRVDGAFINGEIKPRFPATRLSGRLGFAPRSAA